MYPSNFVAIRQQYMSMPPGPEKVRLGNMMRAMQAELENEYDSASGADPGDATPQMIEILDPVSGVPTNAIVNAAPKAPLPAVVSPAIQYKQPGPGHGRLRPSSKAMAQMNANSIARGNKPPYKPDAITKKSVSEVKTEIPTMPEVLVQENRLPPIVQPPVQEQPVEVQQPDAPQGPESAPSPGRSPMPGIPGADQQIADIEKRIVNGTATVQDQLMLNMLKNQRQQAGMLPPGYGDMGHARAGMAGLSNPGYKDVEEGAMQFLPSLIQMLGNLNRVGR